MTRTLILLLGAGLLSNPLIAQIEGGALAAYTNKIIREIVTEKVPPEKMLAGPEYTVDRMIEKMCDSLDDMKKAVVADCVDQYGAEKKEACTCMADNTDYDLKFSFMKIAALGDSERILAEGQTLIDATAAVYQSCGFSEEEVEALKKSMM